MRVFVVVSLFAAACLDVEPPPGLTLFQDTFEGCSAPCGWKVTRGDTSLVTTFHPSQHAMVLAPGTAIERDANIVRDPWIEDGSNIHDGHWVEYTSTCPGAPRVTLALATTGKAIELTVELPPGAPGDDFELTRSNLPPFRDPPGPDPKTTPTLPIGVLRVTTEPGCTLDNLRVAVAKPEYGP